MEKGANGFSISDKKSSSSNTDVVVSLMKLHSTPSKICMTSTHQETNLSRPFDGGTGGGGRRVATPGGGGGGVGPTGSNSGGANEVVGNINRDDVSSSCGVGENLARSSSTNSQPFDIFAAHSTTPYKSPGMMAANVGFPFTSAQWKELERQAMIYKYMMSSVPVPPDLLFPLSRSFPPAAAVDSSASSLYNVRCSKNGDPEPGRCKRTDGKKWRCSRDVAPHQKYCERHLHRGRPRSRKPVEVKNNGESHKKTRLEQSPLPNSTPSQQFVAANEQPLMLFNANTDLSISTAPSYNKGTNRDLGLMMEGEMAAMNGADQKWQHLIEANMGIANEGSFIYSSSALFHQDYVEEQSLNLLSYPNFPAPEIEVPAGFIDAWSLDNLNSNNNGSSKPSMSTNLGNLSPSLNLSIAMAAGSILDEEMGKVQMGGGVKFYDEQSTKDSSWSSPVSWEPFARGGPLAEALHPGSVTIGCINPASPHDSISTPATTVSSPSGVLHRTLFSHSDSSVCNSPTFGAPPSEVAFQRLN
ncbi:Growth-regulating factor 7 [Sesamum alatum]|uniref:Growth-regulating factor n=1 Tax=Sesamum alatum TaxID=300844 RepID=A0AAE2CQX6_9LAMI|nr:Growth-regulating factor 7 [Sesamum alatum]